MARVKRPSKFTLGPFEWVIKYLDIEHECHGETYKDTREIQIYIKDRQEQIIKDTLLHELLHVILEDIVDTCFMIDDKAHVAEEQMIRLSTPRLQALFKDNEDLREYVFS